MESVGALGSPTGVSSNLLSLPAPYPWDEDEESLGLEGIKPKSSPIPRRRSSSSSDDFLPPPSSSRRVSFADAFGLSLVSVKQFDTWGVTTPPVGLESDLNEDKEYYIVPLCTLSQTDEELVLRVQEQKLELESLELLSGTTTLRGIIRVLNVCFDKMVYVRTSLDSWRSHFDLLAEYIPGSNCGEMDCFSFKLTLVPPFGEEGVRVDFCLKYDTSAGTFWANNNGNNYSLLCCEKMKEKLQNESDNRRKSCLKITSTNVSASTASAANAEEIPDINLSSGRATYPECLKEKILEKETKEIVEEISRNRSRRNRRKAARLAKVKEHFAKRAVEKNQGTTTKESECTAETSMQEHAPVLEKSPLSQQTARPPTANQTPDESLKTEDCSGEFTDIYSQALTEHEEDTMMNSKINLSMAHTNISLEESRACSASEVLEDIQITEDVTDQNVSTSQTIPVSQNPDLPICKNVERAWENFEKDAKQRIKNLTLSSKMLEDPDISDGKPEDNVTTNAEPQFSHGFTFGTIVAPLYHQVFKNMEIAKKDFFQKSLQEDKSVPTPETCKSTKQTLHDNNVGTCKKSTTQNSQLTPNPHSEPTKAEDSLRQNDNTDGIQKYPTDITFTQTKVTSMQPDPFLGEISPALTEQPFQDNPHHSPCLFSLQGQEHLLTTNQTIESDNNNLPEQINPSSPTSVLTTSLSLDDQITCIETEMQQNQGDPTNIQTKDDNILVQTICDNVTQSLDDPKMIQTSGKNLDSSDDTLEPDSCEMRSTNENLEELANSLPIELPIATTVLTEQTAELENTPKNMSLTLESCQMNEEKEQMLIGFSTQTSEKESSSIGDEEYSSVVITEVEENSKIIKDERLEEEEGGCGNQVKQMKNQKEDNEETHQELEEQECVEEEEVEDKGGIKSVEDESAEGGEDKRGIKSIEDELKYIDDEEDFDAMETERQKKEEEDEEVEEEAGADDLLSLEDQKDVSTCNIKSLPHPSDETESLDEVQVLETEVGTATSWHESSQKSETELSGSTQAMERDWDLFEFIDKVDCCEGETTDDVNKTECQAQDSMNRDPENTEDNTSTESQIDDEMELYLNCLRNSQQSVFREGTMSGNYGKRPSISRGRPLAMPSISESVYEDQSNNSLEDLTNIEDLMELERATLPLVDGNEHVIGRNVLWWKEFLSYDNMSRVMGYTFLFIVFLVAAYYYDFIACFSLYLLTVYWLFCQGDGEQLKNSHKRKRGLQ